MNDEPETMRAKACLCGMPLTGAAALIGVCADCVLASTLAENTPRNRQPHYGFSKRRKNAHQ
jgi:hypothetical protein